MCNNISEALDRARVGSILRERNVSSHVIIIGREFRKNSPKVLFVDHDQMISALAPDRSLSSSPWILGAPQSGFSKLIRRMSSRPRPATAKAGFPPPVGSKAHTMPTHDRLGPDNRYCIKDAREAAIKPDEQSAIGPSHVQPTWRTPSSTFS